MKTLRKTLESEVGNMSDEEFYLLLDLVTDDIKINRIIWHKRTSLVDLVRIVKIRIIVLGAMKKTA